MNNEFYKRKLNISNEVYNIDDIMDNYYKIKNKKIFNDIINQLLDITKNIESLELLLNINYHSIIWEYLNINCYGLTNGIYQEFKYNLFGDISSQSKLNNLMGFNDRIAILVIKLKGINHAQ